MSAAVPYRLAIVASHVIQYQDPLFRRIARETDIDLTVLYCSRRGVGAFHDRDMGTEVTWDVKGMLQGYRYRFLRNASPFGEEGGFTRFVNPGIAGAIARGGFDAVIFMIGWGSITAMIGMLACRVFAVPFFIFGDSSYPPPETTFARKLRARFLRTVFRLAGGFMITSPANAGYYRHYGADEHRFFPMPFAIDNERFEAESRMTRAERDSLRGRYGIAADAFTIVDSGKLVTRKDPLTLLRAFEAMQHRDRSALLFVGDGELRPELERYVTDRSLTGVHFTRFVNQNDLPRLYAIGDVLVLPSVFEPLGLVVNEAMASGLPVIVSDRCGCIGGLAIEGENALVFPAADASQLARHLDTLAGDESLRARMAQRSREIIATCSYDREVDGIRQMLASLPERNGR